MIGGGTGGSAGAGGVGAVVLCQRIVEPKASFRIGSYIITAVAAASEFDRKELSQAVSAWHRSDGL